jgi:hypothetical protein
VILSTFNPCCGIATRVEATDDDDLCLVDDVVQRIGEPSKRDAANLTVHDWERGGVLGQEIDRDIDDGEECFAQASLRPFVPSARFGEVSLR